MRIPGADQYLEMGDEEALEFETRPTVRMRTVEKLAAIAADLDQDREAQVHTRAFLEAIPNDAVEDLLDCLGYLLDSADGYVKKGMN